MASSVRWDREPQCSNPYWVGKLSFACSIFFILTSSCSLAHSCPGSVERPNWWEGVGHDCVIPSSLFLCDITSLQEEHILCNFSMLSGVQWLPGVRVGGGKVWRVGFPMLSVPGWVSLANSGCSINRPIRFLVNRLLQYGAIKNEGDIFFYLFQSCVTLIWF